jgi:hypothetical protein
MRAPFWLRRDRRSGRPLRDISLASSGNLAVWLLLVALLGWAFGSASAAGAAALGAGVVLGSTLISWGIVSLPPFRRRADPAPALMLGYVVKVALCAVALALVPGPGAGNAGWLVTGAVGGVVVMLVTEVWAVSRLRILYFGEGGDSAGDRVPSERPAPPDAETPGS